MVSKYLQICGHRATYVEERGVLRWSDWAKTSRAETGAESPFAMIDVLTRARIDVFVIAYLHDRFQEYQDLWNLFS